MDIVIQDRLSDEDARSLFDWDECVFPVEGRNFQWSPPTEHIVAKDRGRAIGHLGVARYTVVSDTEYDVLGIGGVVIRPEYQGRHIPKRLFEYLANVDRFNDKYTPMTLFCPFRLLAYYEKFGFRQYDFGVQFLQDLRYVQSDSFCFMVCGRPLFSGALRIPSLPW